MDVTMDWKRLRAIQKGNSESWSEFNKIWVAAASIWTSRWNEITDRERGRRGLQRGEEVKEDGETKGTKIGHGPFFAETCMTRVQPTLDDMLQRLQCLPYLHKYIQYMSLPKHYSAVSECLHTYSDITVQEKKRRDTFSILSLNLDLKEK